MLLNVRLGAEEARAVRGLRRAKVNISALVRRAIHEAAPKTTKRRVSVAAIVEEVLADIPAPRTRGTEHDLPSYSRAERWP